jgi:hypothetical protein
MYQAARQGREEVVELLVKAGARLGGSDKPFAMSLLTDNPDQNSIRIWYEAGLQEAKEYLESQQE